MNESGSQGYISAETVPTRATHPFELRPSLASGFVYGIKSLDLIKVGVAKDVKSRLFQIRGHNPHGCEVVFKRSTIAPFYFEERMHELLAEHAVGREWFRVSVDQVKAAAIDAGKHARAAWKHAADEYQAERNAELAERHRALSPLLEDNYKKAMARLRGEGVEA